MLPPTYLFKGPVTVYLSEQSTYTELNSSTKFQYEIPTMIRARGANQGVPRSKRGQDIPPPPPQPPPQVSPAESSTTRESTRHTLAQRVQCLTLLVEEFSEDYIQQKTGIPPRTQRYIKKKAFDRGFRPAINPIISEDYVKDGHRSGRPLEIDEQKEEELLAIVRQDRAGREKSSEVLGFEVDISSSSALRILHKHNLSSVKPTRKPGLNEDQKAARLQFALDHKDWTLED